ncbi:hypothetical protein STEG23_025577 [Scotinomys teguina]
MNLGKSGLKIRTRESASFQELLTMQKDQQPHEIEMGNCGCKCSELNLWIQQKQDKTSQATAKSSGRSDSVHTVF